jgi:SAM-dependent methyltransferase
VCNKDRRDILIHNRLAWDRQVEKGNPWTVCVSSKDIASARQGLWQILLTPTKPVPKDWFPSLQGCEVLCLASGGGQQAPILAAAGATVTVLDNSHNQLAQDRRVAERDSLDITTIEGDMADLSMFADSSFALIIHPVSNCFIPDIRPVWAEAFRVLRPGGALLSGFVNPLIYIFDDTKKEQGVLEVKHQLPYSDFEYLSAEEKQRFSDEGRALEFSHSLDDQIGGQIEAGFVISGFYEDRDNNIDEKENILSRYLPVYIATKAIKPRTTTW